MSPQIPPAFLVHASLTLSLITLLFSFGGHHLVVIAIPSGTAFTITLLYHVTSWFTSRRVLVIGTMTSDKFIHLLDFNATNFYIQIILLILAILLWQATFIICIILNAHRVIYPSVVANVLSGIQGALLLLILIRSIKERHAAILLDDDHHGDEQALFADLPFSSTMSQTHSSSSLESYSLSF